MSLLDLMRPKSKSEILEIFERKWNFSDGLLNEVSNNDVLYDDFIRIYQEVRKGDIWDTIYRVEYSQIAGIPDLINSQGPILQIVEGQTITIAYEGISDRKLLYLKGMDQSGSIVIYSKVNVPALELYFQGRLTLKELFLLKIDEPFHLENKKKNTGDTGNSTKEWVYIDDFFKREILDKLNCGGYYYFQLPQFMRVENPFADVIDVLKKVD